MAQVARVDRPVQRPLEARLETAAWGMIAILVGAVLLPSGPLTYWLAALAGAGLLGVSALRRASGIAVNWFSAVLGGVMVVAGAAALAGTHIDVFAAFFLALGIVLVVIAGLRR
jgi:hypothetical protein